MKMKDHNCDFICRKKDNIGQLSEGNKLFFYHLISLKCWFNLNQWALIY